MRILKNLIFPIVATTLALAPQKGEACTGTKQMGMGGTGLTTCDNSHATYWNQANLANLKNAELSYTKSFLDTKKTKYDDTISLAIPFQDSGFGLQYTDSKTQTQEEFSRIQWLKIAGGVKINPEEKDSWQYAVGGAITPKIMSHSVGGRTNEEIKFNYEGSGIAKRQNLVVEGDEVRIGGLVRSIGHSAGQSLDRRVGASYVLPIRLGETTIAANTYDTKSENSRTAGYRLGIEQKVPIGEGSLALRAGFEDLGKKSYSIGAGYENSRLVLGVSITTSPERERQYGLAEVGVKF
jgi:hypothetical protein